MNGNNTNYSLWIMRVNDKQIYVIIRLYEYFQLLRIRVFTRIKVDISFSRNEMKCKNRKREMRSVHQSGIF